jgi:membrane protein YqaA with SNARE-associated domain
MIHRLLVAAATPGLVRDTRHWIFSLGGLGFIPLGFLDASILPIPGSMDVLVIALSAGHADLWPYYALMATLGSVLGALAMYRLARKGGEEMLARRLSRRNMKKVTEIFSRFGFGAIAVPALLPPPVPMVPFVMAAGATQYSENRFLTAMTLGRAVRFTLLAMLGARYGRRILIFVTQHEHPVLASVIVLIVLGGIAFVAMRELKKPRRRAGATRRV